MGTHVDSLMTRSPANINTTERHSAIGGLRKRRRNTVLEPAIILREFLFGGCLCITISITCKIYGMGLFRSVCLHLCVEACSHLIHDYVPRVIPHVETAAVAGGLTAPNVILALPELEFV
jgi:hypothetical protein